MSQVVTETMVRVAGARKSYGHGAAAVHAPRGVSFEVPRGELVALKGRSGPGKTTLLDIVGGLGVPDAGRAEVDGRDLAELDEDGLLALRRDRVGFVFPSFGLLPILTAAENVGVPMRLRRTAPREREERVELLLSWSASPTTPPSGPAASSWGCLQAVQALGEGRPRPRQQPRPARGRRAHRSVGRGDRPRRDGVAAGGRTR